MRQASNRAWWESEREHILGINPQEPGSDFRNDPDCFERYCRMQARFAAEDGHQDISLKITEHLKWVPA